MPKSREAAKTDHTCSFCGQMQRDVPLMIASNTTKACICSWCALGVVEQTFKHGLAMEKQFRTLHQQMAAIQAHEKDTPKIEIAGTVDGKVDKVDLAVAAALKRGIN